MSESVAEVEMSSADPVSEVDVEEQRVARVDEHGDMQDDDQERERQLPQPRLPSRKEVQEHE